MVWMEFRTTHSDVWNQAFLDSHLINFIIYEQDSTSAATRGLSTANSRHFATQSVGVSNYEMQNLGQNGTKSSTTTFIDERTGAERNKTSASHA